MDDCCRILPYSASHYYFLEMLKQLKEKQRSSDRHRDVARFIRTELFDTLLVDFVAVSVSVFFFHFVGVAVSALVLIYQQQFEFVPTLRLQSPFINGLRDNYIGIFGVHSVCCCCCLSTSYTLLTAAAATTTHLRVGMPMLCEWL